MYEGVLCYNNNLFEFCSLFWVGRLIFFYTFALPNKRFTMTRGVMVALQILVLPVQVRILAGQQAPPDQEGFFVVTTTLIIF